MLLRVIQHFQLPPAAELNRRNHAAYHFLSCLDNPELPTLNLTAQQLRQQTQSLLLRIAIPSAVTFLNSLSSFMPLHVFHMDDAMNLESWMHGFPELMIYTTNFLWHIPDGSCTTYCDGCLGRATRGDGGTGENVTANVLTISCSPRFAAGRE